MEVVKSVRCLDFLCRLCVVLACVVGLLQAKTVMVYGDSLSAGYGLKKGEVWVDLLQKELDKKHTIINVSVSGETTLGGERGYLDHY